MHFEMHFDRSTTRRLALGLLGASAALLFASLNLISTAISTFNVIFLQGLVFSLKYLVVGAVSGLVSLIFSEMYPKEEKTTIAFIDKNYSNLLSVCFIILVFGGFVSFGFGGYSIMRSIYYSQASLELVDRTFPWVERATLEFHKFKIDNSTHKSEFDQLRQNQEKLGLKLQDAERRLREMEERLPPSQQSDPED